MVYKLKKAYTSGTTHIVLSPLDFLSRLASLVPRPRVNLTRFHGVFAPHSKHRSLVVPKPPNPQEEKTKNLEPNKRAMTWAQRLKRVFNIDIEQCPECGGKVKIIACIEDPKVIAEILDHLGLDSVPPTAFPARAPPGDKEQSSKDQTTLTNDGFEAQSFPEY